MSKDYILTIAIPTYNRATFLSRLLDSIFSQYSDEVEVLVSDNASTDNTDEIIKKYQELKYIKNSENIGSDANFLQCYEKARGKFVWLVGSDDILLDNTLDYLVEFLKNNDVSHVFLNHCFFKNDEPPNEYNKFLNINSNIITKSKDEWLKIIKAQITFMSSTIIKKDAFLTVQDPAQYIDTWFIHTCIIMHSTIYDNSRFAVLNKCCIADDVTPANANENKNEIWIFEVFGEKLYYVFCKLAIQYGFNKKIVRGLYGKSTCGMFGRAIIRFKSKKIEWKHDFYKFAFPYIKRYFSCWLLTMPLTLIPTFIAKFIYKYLKPLYKKIIKR